METPCMICDEQESSLDLRLTDRDGTVMDVLSICTDCVKGGVPVTIRETTIDY